VVGGPGHQFLLSFLGAASGIVAAILVLGVLFTILRSGKRRSAPGSED
jgi:hypothetical protein